MHVAIIADKRNTDLASGDVLVEGTLVLKPLDLMFDVIYFLT